MTEHQVGTREEWLAARLKLLEAEKAHTQRGDELARMRQELPWVRIDKDYRFGTDGGEASLADLFRGRSQLLIYHFMLGPGWDEGCPSCSGLADGFDETHLHLQNHDVAFTAVSRGPLEKLLAYRDGWAGASRGPRRNGANSITTSMSRSTPRWRRWNTTSRTKPSSKRLTSPGASGPVSSPV